MKLKSAEGVTKAELGSSKRVKVAPVPEENSPGKVEGADFILNGWFFVWHNSRGRQRLEHYALGLQLLDVTTTEKANAKRLRRQNKRRLRPRRGGRCQRWGW
ncbi:MAG: hypothetical protein JRH20_31770 [Deltaproteobacteria bacterium]|nr:hypothetical protein [Deltaproteobacteria bacterium]